MSDIKTLRKDADSLLQEVGRLTNDRCVICGRPYSCLHHFFPKSSCSALRYDLDNCIPVCNGCHLGFHSKRSAYFIGKIVCVRGKEWFESLEKKKVSYLKVNIGYYKDIIKRLESVINKIN